MVSGFKILGPKVSSISRLEEVMHPGADRRRCSPGRRPLSLWERPSPILRARRRERSRGARQAEPRLLLDFPLLLSFQQLRYVVQQVKQQLVRVLQCTNLNPEPYTLITKAYTQNPDT